MYVCIHTYIHTCIHTQRTQKQTLLVSLWDKKNFLIWAILAMCMTFTRTVITIMHAYIHYVYMHTYTFPCTTSIRSVITMYAYIHNIYIYIYTHYIYICMYICTCTTSIRSVITMYAYIHT